ncbi:hypothetical protein [Bradyrhizobium sp. ARR65]|uniref:hypothetical protein n=1 Tax=Bradyrhizobium sp. ARR65 TaxID=1040989 RepID=UPI0004632735|nr:hypothetical protein [Bradyrhizobium sp. ARR65]
MPIVLADAKSAQQLIELPSQLIDCALAELQKGKLGSGSKPVIQLLANALDDLQRLTKIMRRDRKERRFELAAIYRLWQNSRACRSGGASIVLDVPNGSARSMHRCVLLGSAERLAAT